jgi:signal transduction histidine kinase
MSTKKTLGLLGMKERSMMMGGVYNITSAKGVGTTVTVIIPLSKKAV